MDPNTGKSVTQNTNVSNQVDQSTSPEVTPVPQATYIQPFTPKKPKRKMFILIGVIFFVLLLIGMAVFDHLNGKAYSAKIDAFQESSLTFKDYRTSLHTFLERNNGEFAKVYACQANTETLWNFKPLEESPGDSLITLGYEDVTKRLTAQQKALQKEWPSKYTKTPLSGLIPASKEASAKHRDMAQLMSTTEKVLNPGDLTTYCLKAYDSVQALTYIPKYGIKGNRFEEGVPMYQAQLTATRYSLERAKSIQPPRDMSGSHDQLVVAHENAERTLIELIDQINDKGSLINMYTGFQVNKQKFDQAFKEISIVARQIKPQPSELSDQLKKIEQ